MPHILADRLTIEFPLYHVGARSLKKRLMAASRLREDDRVILNMGTWLKILDRMPVRFGYLPSVYYPTFRLNYFHIRAEQSQIVIRYVEIPKTPARELGLLQRFLTVGRKLPSPPEIPKVTTIEVGS